MMNLMTSNEPRVSASRSAEPGMIRQMFANARRVLITSHVRPDGDAVGSLLGLGLALIDAGKDVRMVLGDGVPQNFRHLEGSQQIHRSAPVEALRVYDLVITVDCSDLLRTGKVLGDRVPDLNIDHHVTNLNFGTVNLVEEQEPATAVIIAKYLEEWGLSFTQPIAAALLTGIVTDTLGFRTTNMTPAPLRLSAMLMEHGADLPDLYNRALVNKTFEAARFWGYGLAKLQRDGEKKQGPSVAWTSLTLADRQAAEYPGNDDADLINILSTIDSDVVVIFVEQKNGHVKVSWRARPGIDVSQIALQFGGGGHPAAAGADIVGSMAAVEKKILEATRGVLTRENPNKNGKKPVEA
jgi:bifunctional oligoribonuclease and PAP phosphatase NrnA